MVCPIPYGDHNNYTIFVSVIWVARKRTVFCGFEKTNCHR